MSEPFVGTVMLWAPTFAPRGWAMCAGQTLALSNNQTLFSLISTIYGGNGTTTFQLPNLQGRVPVGTGQLPGGSNYALGQIAGSENTNLLVQNLPAHTHTAQFTGTQSLTATVTLNATSNAATSDKPEAGMQLADATPNSNKIYALGAGGTNVGLAGGAATIGGSIGGTVAINNTGNSIPFSILSPYLAMNYVIALQGVYPSRN